MPPESFLPIRPVISNPEALSKDLIQRLMAFGYKFEDVTRAFSEEQANVNPIRCTYFLLYEMLQREERRMRLQYDKQNSANAAHPSPSSTVGTESSKPSTPPSIKADELPTATISTTVAKQAQPYSPLYDIVTPRPKQTYNYQATADKNWKNTQMHIKAPDTRQHPHIISSSRRQAEPNK